MALATLLYVAVLVCFLFDCERGRGLKVMPPPLEKKEQSQQQSKRNTNN